MTVPVSNTCGNFVCCYVDVIFNILPQILNKVFFFKIFVEIFEFRDGTLHRAFATECHFSNLDAFGRGDSVKIDMF